MIRFCFVRLATLLAAACASPDTQEGRAQAVDAVVQEVIAASDVPGASVAIVHQGDVV